MMIRRSNAVIAVCAVLATVLSSASAWVTIEMRADALARARASSENVALLIERDVSRNLQVYDLSLEAVVDALKDRRLATLPADIRQNMLFDRSASAKDMGAIFVANAHGDVIYDSRSVPPRRFNIADRDYFIAHRDSSNDALLVSHPLQPRPDEHEMSIALSRRINRPDGSFGGVVVGTMRLNYFRNLFSDVNLGSDGSLTLSLADGTLLMRRPYAAELIGTNQTRSEAYRQYLQTQSNGFFSHGPVDGVERWFSFRRVSGFPLVIGVGIAQHDIYDVWRVRAWIIGVLTVVLDLTLLALGVQITLQFKRRRLVEKELREQAGTDALTGLANRRAFEERANAEWARAQRTGGPLSFAMVDVDRFKAYNDQYGHAAGDHALASVARVVGDHARRPGDCAGRYGGEEFVLMLAGTSLADAQAIAERVRAAVEALALRHAGSPGGVLTLSAGVASTSQAHFESWQSLASAADVALYAAKHGGRNRVEAHRASASGAARDPGVAT